LLAAPSTQAQTITDQVNPMTQVYRKVNAALSLILITDGGFSVSNNEPGNPLID